MEHDTTRHDQRHDTTNDTTRTQDIPGVPHGLLAGAVAEDEQLLAALVAREPVRLLVLDDVQNLHNIVHAQIPACHRNLAKSILISKHIQRLCRRDMEIENCIINMGRSVPRGSARLQENSAWKMRLSLPSPESMRHVIWSLGLPVAGGRSASRSAWEVEEEEEDEAPFTGVRLSPEGAALFLFRLSSVDGSDDDGNDDKDDTLALLLLLLLGRLPLARHDTHDHTTHTTHTTHTKHGSKHLEVP
jgi:hypothetical protein